MQLRISSAAFQLLQTVKLFQAQVQELHAQAYLWLRTLEQTHWYYEIQFICMQVADMSFSTCMHLGSNSSWRVTAHQVATDRGRRSLEPQARMIQAITSLRNAAAPGADTGCLACLDMPGGYRGWASVSCPAAHAASHFRAGRRRHRQKAKNDVLHALVAATMQLPGAARQT